MFVGVCVCWGLDNKQNIHVICLHVHTKLVWGWGTCETVRVRM